MTMKSLNQSPSRLPRVSEGPWAGEVSLASQEISLWTWFFTAMVKNASELLGQEGSQWTTHRSMSSECRARLVGSQGRVARQCSLTRLFLFPLF